MIEVVFFDAGETLLHPHPSFAELFSEVCRRDAVEVDSADVRAAQERLAPHLVDLNESTGVDAPSLSAEGSRRFWSYLYRRLLEEFDIEDERLVGELYATFSNTSSYKLFDDALDVLDSLTRDGYRLGLISNFERWLEEMLIELEVGGHFELTVISGVEGVEKPDLRIYEAALEKAGVEARRTVHVGDSPVLDVEPALAVGMNAVLVDRVGRYPEASGLRVDSLTEVPELVNRL
jgi:putative hydrolase of the HAD superfamily